MAVLFCKTCGSALEFKNNESTVICHHCGTRQDDRYLQATALLQEHYARAKAMMSCARTQSQYKAAGDRFWSIRNYLDAAALAQECYGRVKGIKRDIIYIEAKKKLSGASAASQKEALRLLAMIPGWRDADALAQLCREKLAVKSQRRQEKSKLQLQKESKNQVNAAKKAALAQKTAAAQAKAAKKEARVKAAKEVVPVQKKAAKPAKPKKAFLPAVTIICGILIFAVLFTVFGGFKGKESTPTGEQTQPSATVEETQPPAEEQEEEIVWNYPIEPWVLASRQPTIATGPYHTVAVKNDGTVVATGRNDHGECNVEGWTDIISVAASDCNTVGLKADGTVVVAGSNDYGQCDVADWTDIVAIASSEDLTIGLRSDGTVLAVGENEYGEGNVAGWTDIVAISASFSYTVGLKSDGTVVATGLNDSGQCNVEGWTDIVAISTYGGVVGLKADGTVMITGYYSNYQGFSGRTDVVAITGLLGLTADGTLITDDSELAAWTDIVAISAGGSHNAPLTLGLKADGTVIVTEGFNLHGQRNVETWTDIKIPDSLALLLAQSSN